MITIQTIATFFGWCTVINLVVLIVFFIVASAFHDRIGRILARLFGVSETAARETMLRVFMQYRLAFAVLNLVPYIALKLMA